MKIAVLSDSHDNLIASEKAIDKIKSNGIHVIFHLGDIVSPFTLLKFMGFEYYGVFGNNDGEKLLLNKIAEENGAKIEKQPLRLVFDGLTFLLYHGTGSVDKTRKTVEAFALSGQYDFVLYGHTHMIDNRKIGNCILLNPGEVCGYLFGKQTFAIIDSETQRVKFVSL